MPGLVLVLVLWLLLLQLVILRRGEALLAGEGAQAAISLGGSRLVPSRHSARASAKPKATLGTAGSKGGQRLKAAVGKGGLIPGKPKEQDEGPGAGGVCAAVPGPHLRGIEDADDAGDDGAVLVLVLLADQLDVPQFAEVEIPLLLQPVHCQLQVHQLWWETGGQTLQLEAGRGPLLCTQGGSGPSPPSQAGASPGPASSQVLAAVGMSPAYLLVELQDLRVGLGAPVTGRGGVFPEDAAGDIAEAGWVGRALGASGRGPLGDLTTDGDQWVNAGPGGCRRGPPPPRFMRGGRGQEVAAGSKGRQSTRGRATTPGRPAFSLPPLPQCPLADLTPSPVDGCS